MCKVLLVLLSVTLLAASTAIARPMWVKGNIHTHTTESDGDHSPQAVADWYSTRGYDFLMITDHNKLTDISQIKVREGFLLIPGEEISAGYAGTPIHVNALGVDKQLAPVSGTSKMDTLRKNVKIAVDAGGLAMINHPNWHYALTAAHIARAGNCNLFEIANCSSDCNNDGDAEHPSLEVVWDEVLTQGVEMYGVADDDTHHYQKFGPELHNPGRGWIAVRVNKLTRQDVLSAISRGDFYSSTGVELEDIRFRDSILSVAVKPAEAKTYRIQFIGSGGKIVDEKAAVKASCEVPAVRGSYLRAKVIASDGAVAWIQPHRRSK